MAKQPNGSHTPTEIDTDQLMQEQRERYSAELAELNTRRDDLMHKLARVERYFQEPVVEPATPAPRQPRQPTGPRAPRGSVKAKVEQIIVAATDGIKPQEIAEKAEASYQSVQNVLSKMKKDNEVKVEGGKYFALPKEQQELAVAS